MLLLMMPLLMTMMLLLQTLTEPVQDHLLLFEPPQADLSQPPTRLLEELGTRHPSQMVGTLGLWR